MSDDQLYGQNGAFDAHHPHNQTAFQIAQALNAISTATICKVIKCTNAGEVKAIGKVDVLPLVDLRDGIGRTSQHVNVLSLPYMRFQAGAKSIIMDPKPGDLGLVVFADRDTAPVRKTKKQSPPGSKRRFNMADGMYVGTVLSSDPTSYIQFMDDGSIKASPDNGVTWIWLKMDGSAWVTAPTKVVVDCPDIRLGGDGATRQVALMGSVTTDGASIVSNLSTKVKAI